MIRANNPDVFEEKKTKFEFLLENEEFLNYINSFLETHSKNLDHDQLKVFNNIMEEFYK